MAFEREKQSTKRFQQLTSIPMLVKLPRRFERYYPNEKIDSLTLFIDKTGYLDTGQAN